MWKLYILNCDDKYFYTGITTSLDNRLKQHRNKQSRFTRRFSKIALVYTEEFEDREDAVARERKIKGWNRRKKMELIVG